MIQICLTAVVGSLLLAFFSVYPFTKIALPWVLADQWRRVHFPASSDQDCIATLQELGVRFSPIQLPPIHRANGCAIDTALILYAGPLPYINVAFAPTIDYTTLSCQMALRMHSFVEKHVIADAELILGQRPVMLLHKGGYSCRRQESFVPLQSSHAFAEAIDIAGVRLADNREILVESDYRKNSAAGAYLRGLAAAACQEFGTALGPPYDEHHRDHLHISLSYPQRCVY